MSFRIYGYLRASTKEQDAKRAKEELEHFIASLGYKKTVSHWFVENESGSTLNRPELFRLLDIAQPKDVLLVEQVDRLSRLNNADWNYLKRVIESKKIKIVSADLPSSYLLLDQSDAFTGRILEAVNSMLLDFLAAFARKDYHDRRIRQKQGIEKAKKAGRYKGRPEDKRLHYNIEELLSAGKSWTSIQNILNCSRHTISKVSKRMKGRT